MREEAKALQAECESYALRNSPDGRRSAMRRALDAAYDAGFAAGSSVRQAEYDRLMAQVASSECERDAAIAERDRLIRDIHAARLEWAMAVTALLAWVRYGEGER